MRKIGKEEFDMKLLFPTTKLPLLILLFTLLLVSSFSSITAETYYVEITAQTDKQDYYVREPVTIQGTFTSDSQPITDALIAMEIRNPDDNAFAYRTVSIGDPQETFFEIYTTITDANDNPITVTRINRIIKIFIEVRNTLLNEMNVTIAYALYDNILIPISSSYWIIQIYGQSNVTVQTTIEIPEWAKPGKAIISTDVYSNLPKDGGVPYTPERLDYIDLVLNDQLPPPYSEPPVSFQTQAGQYQIYLRTSPDAYALSGNYTAYVSGETNGTLRASNSTIFNVFDYPMPPQASFTHYPPALYENMSATFDANSSSAEGYHDHITRLEWTIDDPNNPENITKTGNPPNPLATHTFVNAGTYLVTLNVTDNQELWTTISKPVAVDPEFGPTADFNWTPYHAYPHNEVVFNASLTKLGWSKPNGQYSPITQYTWNFGDQTENVTTSNPITPHQFPTYGNFTVTLTVTDARGRTDSKSKTITILNYTSFPWDVNGDGYVGIDDIFAVATHFGLSEGDPGWDPIYDITADGYIGVDDIFEVATHFGEEAPK
jgi:hypothetical protein